MMRTALRVVGPAVLWLWATLVAARPALPDFTGLVERNAPAVVNISTLYHGDSQVLSGDLSESGPLAELLRRFLEQEPHEPRDSESLGSGFIISPDGYILTARHVVAGADRILVRLTNRDEYEARVVGSDEASDVALLKVDARELPTVEIGNSRDLKIGAWVLAIGSPFGFDSTVTAGIVSAKGRSLPSENYIPYIQTDVAINPGSSGGPLFDLDGRVVGINSQILSRSGGFMGLSFAVPIELAMRVVEQLQRQGHVSRGYLGVLIQDMDLRLARSLGLEHPRGALVAQVMPDSPAARAGMQVGDVIVSFGDHPIRDSAELPPLVGAAEVGRRVPLEIRRGGRLQRLEVELRELPPDAPEALPEDEAPAPRSSARSDRLGLEVEALTEAERKSLELPPGRGVAVAQVHPGPARQAEIEAGDVILMIDGQPVEGPEDYARRVSALPAGRNVAVLVQKADGPLFVALEVPESQGGGAKNQKPQAHP